MENVVEITFSTYTSANTLSTTAGGHLRAVRTRHRRHRSGRYGVTVRVHPTCGRRPLPPGIAPAWGSTEHLDLHWGNVTIPNLTILDWEHWGTGVAGSGAARLYCTALAAPETAEQLHATFADILDSPSGRYALLVAAADILVNVACYEDTVNLCPALHQLTRKILNQPERPGEPIMKS